MARTSKHEHLKPAILEQFALGKSVSEVARAFPEVPKQTLRDWGSSLRLKHETTPHPPAFTTRNEIEAIAQAPLQQESVDSVSDSVEKTPLKVVSFRERSPSRIATKEESEFEIAVRTLKDIAEDYNAPQAVRVQSAIALLKVAQMKLETPAIASNGEQEAAPDVQSEREKLKDMDASELRRKYLEALG